MEGETSGGYNHQRGKAVTGNDYNDKNTTAATTIMRSCSSCNLGVLCRMLTAHGLRCFFAHYKVNY